MVERMMRGARRRGVTGAAIVVALAAGLLPTPARAATPVQAPTIQSPLPGEPVNANPVLQWDAVPGAVKYRLQVSTSPTFASTIHSPQDTSNTKATIPNDLPLGTIYWRVAATDGTYSGVGPFASSSFERVWANAPQPISPADGAILTYPEDPVSFEWEPLPASKKYEVHVSDDVSFTAPQVYETVNPALTLKEPQTVDQPFYWRVRAVAVTGMNSAWSDTRSYTIVWPTVPVLTSPADQTATPITDVVLDWEPVEGAATYQVQVSPNGQWANNVVLDVPVKGTRYSPPITLNNGDYFWRVRARDAKAPQPNLGGWSVERQFKRGWPQRPVLVAPANYSVMTMNPTFEWDPVEHASHYQLDVSTDINFSTATQSCITTHTTYTPYVLQKPTPSEAKEAGPCNLSIAIGPRYYWRVRGLDGPQSLINPLPIQGLWSNFGTSDTFTFVFKVPVPEPVAPADDAVVHAPALKWEPVQGQGRYRVLIHDQAGTPQVDILTYATSYTPTKRLSPGTYRWYVLTENATSGRGINDESKHRTFELVAPTQFTDVPTPIGPADEPQTPEDERVFTNMPAMSWTPVANAHHYSVWYSPDSGTFSQLTTAELPYAGFTRPEHVLSPGKYQWQVRAHTQAGGVLATGPQAEFTIETLPEAQYTAPCTTGVSCVVGDTPTLEWEHVPNAGSYVVYLALDPNFTNIIREYRTVFNELRPREALLDSQAGQSFYWFVQPCLDPDRGYMNASPCGAFNSQVQENAFSFKKRSAPAELSLPANEAEVVDEVTFEWTDYLETSAALATPETQEARKYHIQVSTANTFATILDEDWVDQKTYTPFAKTYPDGPLFWRVQALDGSANPLTFSEPRKVMKSSPPVQPLAPMSGSTLERVPTFRWEPLAFAAKYEVEVYKNADTLYSSTNRIAHATTWNATKLTGWTPETTLPGGTYAWRVRRLDVDNHAGVWSGGGTFTLAPSVPALTSPANGASVHTDALEFTWAVSNAAVQYRFQSSTSASFSTIFEQQLTSAPAWAPSQQYPDGTYYWRVQVLDSASNVIATSAVWSFTKQTPMTTSLTLAAAPVTVSDTGSVSLSGRLTRKDNGAALPERDVNVMGRFATATTFKKLATVKSDPLGNVTFSHTPRRSWVYQFQYPTNGVVVGSVSPKQLVQYQPVVRTTVQSTAVRLGGKTTISGTIAPYFKGRLISLQKMSSSGTWKTIKSKELGAPANTSPPVTKFSFPIYGTKSGFFYYRVLFKAKSNVNLEGAGPSQIVQVN